MKIYLCALTILILFFAFTETGLAVNAADSGAVKNEFDLFKIEENPYGDYYLTDDIILNNDHPVLFNSSENMFHGTLDGNGHTVFYLSVDETADVFAFIGYSDGIVKNIMFKLIYPTVKQKLLPIGGVVAHNYGEVIDCFFDLKNEKTYSSSTSEVYVITDRSGSTSSKETRDCHSEETYSSTPADIHMCDNFCDSSRVTQSSEPTESMKNNKVKEKEEEKESVNTKSEIYAYSKSTELSSEEEEFSEHSEKSSGNAIGIAMICITSVVIIFSFIYAVTGKGTRKKDDKE